MSISEYAKQISKEYDKEIKKMLIRNNIDVSGLNEMSINEWCGKFKSDGYELVRIMPQETKLFKDGKEIDALKIDFKCEIKIND